MIGDIESVISRGVLMDGGGGGILGGGDRCLLISIVRSMKSCFGGMITSFCFLALFEMMVFGHDMVIWLRFKKMM